MSTLMMRLLRNAGIAYAPEGTGTGADAGNSGTGNGGDGTAPNTGTPPANGTGAGTDGQPPGGDGAKPDAAAEAAAAEKATADAAALKAAEDAAKADEYKPDDKKTPEENAKLKTAHDAKVTARKELTGAPEKYADLVVPDGMQLDQAAASSLMDLGKTLNISQKGMDQIIGIQRQMYERAAAEQATALAETLKEWDATNKADPVVGGKKYDENRAIGKSFLTTFGTPDLVKYLEDTKLSENPMLVKLFVEAGMAMGEGRALGGGRTQGGESAADIIYGKK